MTIAARPNPQPFQVDPPQASHPALIGLACATPAIRQSQQDACDRLAKLWGLKGASRARWDRIVRGSAIASRSAVVPIDAAPKLTTGERMRLYERHAPDLARRAAADALRSARVDPARITDLIVVTCTGFAAPGVDVELQNQLKLARSVRRSTIGFMGCFGAITGLRAALGACMVDPKATVLLVCVELCSLHLRDDDDIQNQVASALFADGAAAAVLTRDCASIRDAPMPTSGPTLALIHPGCSRLIPERRDDMTWRITDEGFAMTLSPSIPAALESELPSFLAEFDIEPRGLAIHPGGAAILDAAARAVPPELAPDIDHARAVLRNHGNMSSPTVLFVLERLLRARRAAPITLLAFGPGLTIDTIMLS